MDLVLRNASLLQSNRGSSSMEGLRRGLAGRPGVLSRVTGALAVRSNSSLARFDSRRECTRLRQLVYSGRGWSGRQSWQQASDSSSTVPSSALNIELVPCLVDNYAYLLHDTTSGVTGVVDPSAAGPVVKALNDKGLGLSFILNTHHHWDHTGGNVDLKREYNAKVVGPKADQERIPGIDLALRDGEKWMFGSQEMRVLFTPGHTRGHVSFYFPDAKAVFTGDTLFSIGCGRLFEGSAEQMWTSLQKIASLPDDTSVYCGHEYTMANAKFALSVEPRNKALVAHFEKIKDLRQRSRPTIPTTLEEEKLFNPFLRPFSEEVRKSLEVPSGATDAQVFAAVRSAKDRF